MTSESSPTVYRLVCCGDATAIHTWSNTPYFVLAAGQKHGFLLDGLRLEPSRLRRRRLFWNLQSFLTSGRWGGFQYSEPFCRLLMAQAGLSRDKPLRFLSHFPLLPGFPWPDQWQVAFYIDATTKQVFRDYDAGKRISRKFQEQVLARERAGYERATHVITMCQWAADSVVEEYGIPPSKVSVVPGGANLEDSVLVLQTGNSAPPPPSAHEPLRIGFIGKDWRRKGGPFLLEVTRELNERGVPAVVRAIGPSPTQISEDGRVQALGFIDKQANLSQFVREVSSWHFGALFSLAEAAPRSNLECLRLGVPILCHAIGGIASTVPDEGCGKLFAPHPSPGEVASWIQERIQPYQGYLAWRARLSMRGQEFTWSTAAEQILAILQAAPS